ncbi:MAG: hypothetical protein KKA07_02495 [Bacteroidetes bacterium]|nr:hypothetical protein [Bacteroidota bacterium]MBU1717919.1 hypothetical protein [Bacteroidota bacterium]
MPAALHDVRFFSWTIRLLIVASFSALLTTGTFFTLYYEKLQPLCICSVNYLAWSWEFWGGTLLSGFIAMFGFMFRKAETRLPRISVVFSIFSALTLFIGFAFFIIFACRVLEVI